MARITAVWPLIVAVETTLVADTTIAGLLSGGKVYSGTVPVATPLDYILLTSPTEHRLPILGSKQGSDGLLQIDLWCRSFYNALNLATEVSRVLDQQKLTLDPEAHAHVRGTVELILVQADPDDDLITHGVMRYEWTTMYVEPD